MILERSCGILMHPTSLPGDFGIGDFGSESYSFIDFLATNGQSYWQILPLTYPGKGNSPYSPISSFAGNPLLISIEGLFKDGLLDVDTLENSRVDSTSRVDFGSCSALKESLFRIAFTNFDLKSVDFVEFCKSYWLNDFVLFRTLLAKFDNAPWSSWHSEYVNISEESKALFIRNNRDELNYHKFLQFQFEKQWLELKEYANQKGVEIIGDIPLYVSYNSADVWANKGLFQLDEELLPTAISGCPPDYFNEMGQIWENPLYDWEKCSADDYSWWRERIKHTLKMTNIVRLDHFIGFTRYWSIPVEDYDARRGSWQTGPGASFFNSLHHQLGELPLIAEDLGSLSPEVIQLKEEFNFPGMLVMHYCFGDNYISPLTFPKSCLVYPGTHDNNTTKGWFMEDIDDSRVIERVENYLTSLSDQERHCSEDSISWDIIEVCYSSSCEIAMVTIQDLLSYGAESKMNRPGVADNNWEWRLLPGYQEELESVKLNELMKRYKRYR